MNSVHWPLAGPLKVGAMLSARACADRETGFNLETRAGTEQSVSSWALSLPWWEHEQH